MTDIENPDGNKISDEGAFTAFLNSLAKSLFSGDGSDDQGYSLGGPLTRSQALAQRFAAFAEKVQND